MSHGDWNRIPDKHYPGAAAGPGIFPKTCSWRDMIFKVTEQMETDCEIQKS